MSKITFEIIKRNTPTSIIKYMDKERVLAEATNKGYKPGIRVKSLDNLTAKIIGKPFIHNYHTNLVVVEATPEFDPEMVLNITIYDDKKQKWAQII